MIFGMESKRTKYFNQSVTFAVLRECFENKQFVAYFTRDVQNGDFSRKQRRPTLQAYYRKTECCIIYSETTIALALTVCMQRPSFHESVFQYIFLLTVKLYLYMQYTLINCIFQLGWFSSVSVKHNNVVSNSSCRVRNIQHCFPSLPVRSFYTMECFNPLCMDEIFLCMQNAGIGKTAFEVHN